MSYRRMRQDRETEERETPTRPNGSLIAAVLVIIGNDAVQKLVTFGVVSVMMTYLRNEYCMTPTKAGNVIFLWEAATSVISLLGGFLSDSYLGRFLYVGFGSLSTALGMLLLWLTTMIPKLKPHDCSPTKSQLNFLYSCFALISIGAGGVNCSIAFVVDQLKISKQQRALARFLMIYQASSSVLVLIAYIGSTNIPGEFGWRKTLGVPVILLFLFAILFFLASPFYTEEKPKKKNLFISFIQVLVVSCKNRKLPLPPPNSRECYLHEKDSDIDMPSDKLSFFNRACTVGDGEQNIAPDGPAVTPWSICTAVQVEEFKALIKVIPLWSTGIVLFVAVNQTKFVLLQASSMDRHLSKNFEIPEAVFVAFSTSIMFIWIVLYNTVILPLASKIRGQPVQLDIKTRMGIGLVFSCLAMAISVLVEITRLDKVLQEGNSMGFSAMWLFPQLGLMGLAEAFTAIGHTEFFYTEFPRTMSSVAVSLLGLETTAAYWLSGVVVNAVSDLTLRGGKHVAWNDTNEALLKKYYEILAVMSSLNVCYFLICSWAYGPCEQQSEKKGD